MNSVQNIMTNSITRAAVFLLLIVAIGVCALLPLNANTKDFDWSLWESLLKTHVTPGRKNGVAANLVDYQAITQSPELNQIAQALNNYDPENLAGKDKMAFYINCYNYFAVAMIINHWPVESIRDIGNIVWPVWYRTAGKINGRTMTLDHIEHEILRPMGDPRIHFAINCASLSCPDLRNEIYTSDRLDIQLDDQMHRFLNDDSKGIKLLENRLKISQIFDWYEEDFTNNHSILEFIRKYRTIPPVISEVDYIPYNWQLNALDKAPVRQSP